MPKICRAETSRSDGRNGSPCTKDNGLAFKKPNKRKFCFKNTKNLPLPKVKKSNLTGIVGISTQKRKYARCLQIPCNYGTKENDVVKEYVPYNGAIDDLMNVEFKSEESFHNEKDSSALSKETN